MMQLVGLKFYIIKRIFMKLELGVVIIITHEGLTGLEMGGVSFKVESNK
jgi:hypothetical protein